MEPTSPIRILILAHDLSDAAVERRIKMLQVGGAQVRVAGFRRTKQTVLSVAGIRATDFGQTFNGGFAQRIVAILRLILTLNRYKDLFASTDIIIARNLEMLAIGVRGRAMENPVPTLVYECLDIHRLLLNRGPVGFILRALEGWLGRRASGIITSSPAFIENYLACGPLKHLPMLLIENKVLDIDARASLGVHEPPNAPPWVIGWFGIIRCRQSLTMLCNLVRQSSGNIRVIIRGRPALDQFDDFYKQISDTPGITFGGPYKNPDDLAGLYGAVHFTWAIDRFEEGLNSSWLLPNRLYEGGKYGRVALAEEHVETGRFLKKLGIGITIPNPLPENLESFFKQLTIERYKALASAAKAVSITQWVHDREVCVKLVGDLRTWARQSHGETHG